MNADTVVIAAAISRILDVAGADEADRLAIWPWPLCLGPAEVPETAAWERLPVGEQLQAEAATAGAANEIGEVSHVWQPRRSGPRVWDVYRDVLQDGVLAESARGLATQWEAARSDLLAQVVPGTGATGPFWATSVTPRRLDEVDWQPVRLGAEDLDELLVEGLRRFPDLVSGDAPEAPRFHTLAFELAVARFDRPWLDLDLMESAGWGWPDGRPAVADGAGGGQLPALAESWVIVRNLVGRLRRAETSAQDGVPTIAQVGPFVVSGVGQAVRSPALSRHLPRLAEQQADRAAPTPTTALRLPTLWGRLRSRGSRPVGSGRPRYRTRIRGSRRPRDRTMWLSGTVTDRADGRPMEGATISVTAEGEHAGTTTTDAQGRYRLAVPVGACDVSVTADGYLPAETTALPSRTPTQRSDVRRARVRDHRGPRASADVALDAVPVEESTAWQVVATIRRDIAVCPAPATTAPRATGRPAGSGSGEREPQRLRRGARGPAVRQLQRSLLRAGLALEIDGVFGGQTEAAVRRFQTERGLVVDGIAGPRTFAALRAERADDRPRRGAALSSTTSKGD